MATGGNPIDPKAVQALKEGMSELNDVSNQVVDVFEKQLEIMLQIKSAMKDMAGTLEEVESGAQDAFSPQRIMSFEKELKKSELTAQQFDAVIKKKVAKNIEILSKGLSIASGFASDLKQGFSSLFAIGTSLFGTFTNLAKGLFEIGASIISIPFKMLDGLFSMAQSGSNEWMQAMENLRKEFGAFSSVSAKAVLTVNSELKGFADTGLSAYQVFGNVAQRLEYITALAKEMGPQFAANAQEFRENGGALLAYQKGLGLSGEQMSAISVASKRMGKSLSSSLNDLTKQSYAMADAFGLDAKIISRDMGKAMQDMSHFGQLSNKELAIAVAYANKLGVSIDKLTGLMDAFDTFDSAAENVSKLNEAFNTNINAEEIMVAQSPAEKLEILRKQFAATGKDMSSLNYAQRKLIQQTTGLDQATFDLAMSQANANVNLDDMKKTGEKAEKKTLDQKDAMIKLADAIERMVQSGSQFGGIFDAITQGFLSGIRWSPEFMKLMQNLNQVLWASWDFGRKLGRMFVELFPGVSGMITHLGNLFDPKKFKTFYKDILDVFSYFGKKDGGIAGNFEGFMEAIKKSFFNFFDIQESEGQALLASFKQFGTAILKIVKEAVVWAWHQLGKIYDKFIDDLQDPKGITASILSSLTAMAEKVRDWIRDKFIPVAKNIINTLIDWLSGKKNKTENSNALTKGLSDLWVPIADGLKLLYDELGPKLLELGKLAAKKIFDALWEAFKKLDWKYKAAIIGYAVGPAIGSVFTSILSAAVGGAVKAAFTNAAQAGIEGGTKAATEAAAKQGNLISKLMEPILGNPYVAAAAAIAALGIVGVGLSKGIQNLKGQMDKDLGEADKKIGSGVAGIIQMLSFGALDDKSAISMANNIAKFSEKVDEQLQKSFGPDFARNLKGYFMSYFDSLVNLGDFIRALFGGNAGDATKAFANLLKSVSVQMIFYFKMIFHDLPVKLVEVVSNMMSGLADWIDTLFQPGGEVSIVDSMITGLKDMWTYIGPGIRQTLNVLIGKLIPAAIHILSSLTGAIVREIPNIILSGLENQAVIVASAIGKLFGVQDLEKSTKKFFDVLKQFFADIGNFIPYSVKWVGDAISKFVEYISKKLTFQDAKLEISDFEPPFGKAVKQASDKSAKDVTESGKTVTAAINKSAEEQKKAADELAKNQLDALGPVTVENAAERFKKIDDLSKQLVSADFNLGGKLAEIRNQLDKVDFSLFSGEKGQEKIEQINKSLLQIQTIKGSLEAPKEFYQAATTSVQSSLENIQKIVAAVQQMDTALSQLDKINIKSRLTEVAGKLSLGSSGIYEVKSKEVALTVNLTVTMDVNKVEDAILKNKESIIRDRINYAVRNDQSAQVHSNAVPAARATPKAPEVS